jgi:pyruvate formate lyase activating enzyme
VQPPYPEDLLSLSKLDRFLEKRAKLLGGVCITGGEPLLHDNLHDLISLIRSHGLKVKLDTNGTFPERLAKADVDYIAMDLKTVPQKYDQLLGSVKNAQSSTAEKVRSSVRYLKTSGIPYELRTTVVPGIIGEEEMLSVLDLLEGVEKYSLTPFRGGETLDAGYTALTPPTKEEMNRLCRMVSERGTPCRLL